MIGIPWVHLKETLANQGRLPLLGWPNDLDPMRCKFLYDLTKIQAVLGVVVVAEWYFIDPEWVDVR